MNKKMGSYNFKPGVDNVNNATEHYSRRQQCQL